MPRLRLDLFMVQKGLVASRSQADSYVKMGKVLVNGRLAAKAGMLVDSDDSVRLTQEMQYVSRAALKLESVAESLGLDFNGKTVLDIGSSTGGFTQYSLKHGAKKVLAVEIGTDQLHPGLCGNPQIELYEKTDIRDFKTDQPIDLVLADVSFISLREILPAVLKLCNPKTRLAVMVKPQFEAAAANLKHKGVIKNDKLRREIVSDFEKWAADSFVILGKADSAVLGAKGNRERFYLMKPLSR